MSQIPPRASRTVTSQYPVQQPDYDIDDDSLYPQRMPSSARRYTTTNGQQVIQRGNQRIVIHNEPPPKKRGNHWLLYIGFGMVFMLALWVGLQMLESWWSVYQMDSAYGFPRTYQTDAIVYPGDTSVHPSHYIFLNLNGTIEVIEFPHDDSQHARIYKGPTLFSDGADLVPVTGEFKVVNGKIEMLIHIQDQTIVYIFDGTQFKPQQ